ncbi:MAG TPA: DUF2520 domain-containing protein [Candidatus Limnocylindria bacterium]|nr:DUF2520 domain-containing protein [Candidatus Limnocylindria bacterium]
MHEREQAPGSPGSGDTQPHAHAHAEPHAHPHAPVDGSDDGRPRLAFIGAGRVGSVLGAALARAGWQVTAVASRDEARRVRFAELVPGVRAFAEPNAVLDEAELIFLTVPDDALAPMADSLKLYSGQALVHTSGALPASVLQPAMAAGTSAASFHPLVAFADFERGLAALSGATVALEGESSLLPLLAEMAESIGARPVELAAEGKAAYHAAAMLAAGGLVGLLDALVEVAAAGAGLDEQAALAVYLPLSRQALANAEQLGVARALTGPLVRGDVSTVAGHLDALRRLAPGALPLYLAVARRELAIAERRGELAGEAADRLRTLLDGEA